MRKLLLLAAAFLLGAPSLFAQSVVAPNIYTNTQAGVNGLNTLIRDSGNARTAQLLISSTQLSSIQIGAQITGLAFRLWSGATSNFPTTTATWADYTINVGVGVAFGSQTTTFASNFVGAPTQVRTGALVVSAASYTSGSISPTPNAYGPTVTFNTPYIYTGGNLLIEVRHTGSNIVNTGSDFLEVVDTTDPIFGSSVWAATATGNAATTGGVNSFTVTQLQFSAVPEPTTMALGGLAIAGAGLVWWRRRSQNPGQVKLSVRR